MFLLPSPLRTPGMLSDQDSPLQRHLVTRRNRLCWICYRSANGYALKYPVDAPMTPHPGHLTGPLQEQSGCQVILKWNESDLSASFRAALNNHIATADAPNSTSPPSHFKFSNTTFSTDPSPASCPISSTAP